MSAFSKAPLLLGGAVLAVAAGAVAWCVLASSSLPDGPVAIAWDKAACAYCSMHVGEPRFAAQLTTKDGTTHAFDDPGCLFDFVAETAPQVHATWFRHLREDRWVPAAAVGFVDITPTPMGFGIGAVDAGAPGAVDLEVARARCRGKRAPQEGER